MSNEDDLIETCRRNIETLLGHDGRAQLLETSYPSCSLKFLQRINKTPVSSRETTQATPASLTSPPAATKPAQSPLNLNIIISGAGLGGLATAIALRRRGHTVTVFEKAPELGEVGAGIQVPPNSSRLLLSWGLGPYLHGKAIEPEAIRIRRWQDGSVIGLTQLRPNFRARYGAPYYVIHRANLQLAMHKLALDLGVNVRVGAGVKRYVEEKGAVVLENDEVHRADLVVAADGIKSEGRRVVLGGDDQSPSRPGFAAYRAMIDVELIRNDPEVSWLLKGPGQNLWIGGQRHVMTYTIAGGKSFNMVLSHPEDSDPSTWNQDQATIISQMKKHFENWDPRLVKVIDKIQTTLKWPLLCGIPLRRWMSPSSKLIIIGDAAHAMVPYMSEGAAMAVEDGAALAELLSVVTSLTQLPGALQIFERSRMLRTGQMQEASLVNGRLWHFEDGVEQRARDATMRAEVEGTAAGESANQWSDVTTADWAYGYDAEEEVKRAWLRSHHKDETR